MSTFNYSALNAVIRKFKIIYLSNSTTLQLENPYDYNDLSMEKDLCSLLPSEYRVYTSCEGIVFVEGENIAHVYDYVVNTVINTLGTGQYYFKNGALFLK